MFKKSKDPEIIHKNISHKPIDYEKLNRLFKDFGKRFTPQQELSAEQAFWLRMSDPTNKPSDALPIKIEAPKEHPKISLVNESLKKLKFNLAKFDNVKITGKDIVDIASQIPSTNTIVLGMFKLDLEPLVLRLQCQNAITLSAKKVVVTPKNKVKKFRLKCSTSKSRSKPTRNKRNDRISQTPSRNMKNKKYLLDDVHDKCLLDFVENVTSHAKSAKTFTIVGNSCPLTRIPSANVVPPKTTTSHSVESQKPELKIYNKKLKNVKNVVEIVLWYLDSGCSKHMTGNRSQLMNFVSKFLGTVRFGNGHIARIMGYGDYQVENVTISRVYYVEGLGHNLFSVGQFCDGDLEVAFWKNTFFIHNLEGFDLLFGSRDINLYIISLDDTLKTYPICLLSKASKTKSWLWHRQLSHLNFGTINKLAKDSLARGIPRLKFQKDHLCSSCALGKRMKSSHQPKLKDITQRSNSFAYGFVWWPMHVAVVLRK
ncbi:integrase, catalytic region, zinc finger, CCHC-type containing protein [Tanacetum coccineum]|uniref:Integrase, catalytic region, zinc finger, CCHC-type containing protein n=1 Tax=Tanacetum coccineum TaxID=301880 RepID=A0ABQ5FFQ4_9ASTR